MKTNGTLKKLTNVGNKFAKVNLNSVSKKYLRQVEIEKEEVAKRRQALSLQRSASRQIATYSVDLLILHSAS